MNSELHAFSRARKQSQLMFPEPNAWSSLCRFRISLMRASCFVVVYSLSASIFSNYPSFRRAVRVMENPLLIQEGSKEHTPLFLIHDGGGTIFQYFLLHTLDRDVWGIHNPNFYNSQKWTGGLSEMAKVYTRMLKSVISSGNVIIGGKQALPPSLEIFRLCVRLYRVLTIVILALGWSLGGCVALEMAHLLQSDGRVHVRGLVMIDSIYPTFRPDSSEFETYCLTFPDSIPKMIRGNVQRCVNEAMYMLSRWQGPHWPQRTKNQNLHSACLEVAEGPPPVVLIRATEELPPNWKKLDAGPRERLLRWDKYRDNFFQEIIDVPSNHFYMFEKENVRNKSPMIDEKQ